jgi:hypothetical protein
MNQRVSGQHSSEIPDKAIALQRWAHNPKAEDFVTLAEVRKNGGLDIAAGENACTVHQFRQMMTAGAVSYAQPSATDVAAR